MTQTIIEAIAEPKLWQPWFAPKRSLLGKQKPDTWQAWHAFLKTVFGLEMTEADLATFRECTGLDAPPEGGSNEIWLICGRRAGKSQTLALIAAYLATMVDWRPYLTRGERGVIQVAAADKSQATVIFRYLRSFIADVKALRPLIVRETLDTLELSNGISCEVAAASYKSIRGRTVVAFLGDEIAFWPTEGADTDKEVLAAIRPAQATVPGAMLLIASSPYARRGELWHAYHKYYGKPGPALVWKASTKQMNPAVPERVIAEAYERDPASAAAEYGAEFRTDIESFIDRALVESLVVQGRHELAPVRGTRYVAFVDPAGGSGKDSMTLAISHRDPYGLLVLDAIREARPPFSPKETVESFVTLLQAYWIETVVGDHWGGEFAREPFRPLVYKLSDLPKSQIYQNCIAHLNSRRVQLLSHPRLISQLCGLERRTARGGRDSIDHPPGSNDDVCNAALGALLLAAVDNKIGWCVIDTYGRVFDTANPDGQFYVTDAEMKRRMICRDGNRDWAGNEIVGGAPVDPPPEPRYRVPADDWLA